MDVGRPVAHTDTYRYLPALLRQEGSDAAGLLHGQVVEGRKASQVGIVRCHFRQACLRPWALADDGLHEADRFIPRTGRKPLAAPWRWATKPDKQHAVKMRCAHAGLMRCTRGLRQQGPERCPPAWSARCHALS